MRLDYMKRMKAVEKLKVSKRAILFSLFLSFLILVFFYSVHLRDEIDEEKEAEEEVFDQEQEVFFIEYPKYKSKSERIYTFLAYDRSLSDMELKNIRIIS